MLQDGRLRSKKDLVFLRYATSFIKWLTYPQVGETSNVRGILPRVVWQVRRCPPFDKAGSVITNTQEDHIFVRPIDISYQNIILYGGVYNFGQLKYRQIILFTTHTPTHTTITINSKEPLFRNNDILIRSLLDANGANSEMRSHRDPGEVDQYLAVRYCRRPRWREHLVCTY